MGSSASRQASSSVNQRRTSAGGAGAPADGGHGRSSPEAERSGLAFASQKTSASAIPSRTRSSKLLRYSRRYETRPMVKRLTAGSSNDVGPVIDPPASTQNHRMSLQNY